MSHTNRAAPEAEALPAEGADDACQDITGTALRSRLGKRSRTKGKTWERAVAALLRPVFGAEVARGFQSRSGRDGCDVEGTAYWVEAKHGKLVNVRAAIRQALAATDGRPVVVVSKDDRSTPLVTMQLSDWLELARRAHAPGGEFLVSRAIEEE